MVVASLRPFKLERMPWISSADLNGAVYLPADMVNETISLDADIFDKTVSDAVAADVLHDPAGKVLKS